MSPRGFRNGAWAALVLATACMTAIAGHSPRRDAGDNRYDIRNIPPALREGASAVVRERETTFNVTDEESATETVRKVVTVFKAEGRGYGVLSLHYDRFNKIKDLDGAILDQHGEEIRTMGGDDIKDESAIAGFTLYEDARVKKVHLYHDTYPYTVVFSYRIAYDGYINWPSWHAQPSDDPVEHSRFEVIVPSTGKLRYWLSDSAAKPLVTVPEKGRTSYVWEARNLPSLSEDQMGEDIELRTTVVLVAPGRFKIDDYPGDMASWQGLARWAGSLYKGRDVLPEASAKDVHAAVAGARTAREKIDTLYRYMQARTRYVSVDLGIGGWQPFEARFVHEKGYGDCKALSNYMVALLREAGIAAYPVLIDAGGRRSDVVESFPSNEFNHVIVCVPEGKDSVWLECTSEVDPPGFLGPSTENRPALLLTPDGGALVHTPASRAQDNRCLWSGRVEIAPAGSAHATLLNVRTGDQSEHARYEMLNASPREQEDWLLGEIEVAGTVLHGHTEEGLRSPAARLSIAVTADVSTLATHSGTRIFFQPNLTDRSFTPPRDVQGRRSPARLSYPYLDTDSLLYIIPKGFACEAMPPPVTLQTPFAMFATAVVARGDTAVLYTRTLEMSQAEIPAAHYNDLAAFYRAVARADKAQVVLAKREN